MTPQIPVFVDSQDEADEYLQGNEIQARLLPERESIQLRARISQLLTERFGPLNGQDLSAEWMKLLKNPDVRFGGPFMWDVIPPEYEVESFSLSEALSNKDCVRLLFESPQVLAYSATVQALLDKNLTDTDLYLMPEDESWLFVITHEEQFGPYFIPLRAHAADSST